MDSSIVKCFICNIDCIGENQYLGINIARTLTMPIASVLLKCLRAIVNVENEFFCTECVKKLEDYDQLIQLTLQIETELYELYRKKSMDSCYLLNTEIISDQNAIIDDEIIQSDDLKLENESDEHLTEVFNETYDEMVIEYLDDFETQSDDVTLTEGKKEVLAVQDDETLNENSPEIKSTTESILTRKKNTRKTKSRIIKSTMKEGSDDFHCQVEQCEFVAETKFELEEHKILAHNDETKRLVCDICGRSYKTKSALCVHIGMHNGLNSHGKSETILI